MRKFISVQYNIWNITIFGAPISILGGDRRVRPLTFLYEIWCLTTSIFGYNAYFWQCSALKWIYFPVSIQYNIWNISIFRGPIPLLHGKIHICTYWLFYTKFNAQQLLYEAFFDIMRIFGSNQSESESFLFQYMIIFQLSNLAPLLGGDRHMRPLTFL